MPKFLSLDFVSGYLVRLPFSIVTQREREGWEFCPQRGEQILIKISTRSQTSVMDLESQTSKVEF